MKTKVSREIKFRAWDGQIMWDNICVNFGKQWDLLNDSPVEGYPIMQYTGLKDKNGREIYEGDIVKSWNLKSENGEPRVCQVIWNRNFYAVKDKFGMTGLHFSDGEFGVEVIGNIYEHPNLLSQ